MQLSSVCYVCMCIVYSRYSLFIVYNCIKNTSFSHLVPWVCPQWTVCRTQWCSLQWWSRCLACTWSSRPPGWWGGWQGTPLSSGQRTPRCAGCHPHRCQWKWTGSGQRGVGEVNIWFYLSRFINIYWLSKTLQVCVMFTECIAITVHLPAPWIPLQLS